MTSIFDLGLFLSPRPVHNWTMEDTVQWLKESVELPQYEKNFRDFRVTGNTLPRSVRLTSNDVMARGMNTTCVRAFASKYGVCCMNSITLKVFV